MEENPSSKTLVTHVFPGGRPPDDATPDVSLSVRERSSSGETNLESSLMLLGDSLGNSDPQDVVSSEQGSSKITAHDPVSTDVVMEAPIVPPSSPNNGSTLVGLQTSTEGLSSSSAGVSYATMVAKNLRNIPGAGGDIVQDKDNCAHNTSTAPLFDVTPAAEVTPILELTAATPYGPWMVPGTQFSILAGNDDHGGSESTDLNPIVEAKANSSTSVGKESSRISLNEAYMASNPQKKIENVPRKAGLVGGKVTNQRGNVGSNFSDARRGFPIRKSTEVRLSNATNVSSWVQDLAQQLSAAKSTGCSSHCLSGVSSELSDKERPVSASGDGTTVDTGQVSTVTEGASTVQAVMRQIF
ncbi:hypothetical protein V6N12_016055 [Hibiscus sabdariffa]|uniref:Uncharacterized protein n=1 Tax=Hibiscus sabdariffa TaxID=183260 RepID=A0ABR2AMA7_9ROSI